MVQAGTPGIPRRGGTLREGLSRVSFSFGSADPPQPAAAGRVRPWLCLIRARLRCGTAWGNICPPDVLCFISPESQPRHVNKAVPIACPQVFMVPRQRKQTNRRILHTGLRSILRAPRATSAFFPRVPATVIRTRTHGKHVDMKANVHNFTHACRSWCSRRNTWAAAARLPCHTSHHPCGSIKVALAAFGLVSEDCFSQ